MKAKIRWVRGNEVLLKVNVTKRDDDGVFQPVDIDGLDEWKLAVVTMDTPCGCPRAVRPKAYAGENTGEVVANITADFPCGTYGIEFMGKKDGVPFRAYESSMFGIVERNGKASIIFEPVEGEKSVDVNLEVQLMTNAVVREENVYEEWKKIPGNENKTLDDFLDTIQHVQSDWSVTDPSEPAFIKNKPTQAQSDWSQTETTAVDYIKNKPELSAVAASGNYADLSNKPIKGVIDSSWIDSWAAVLDDGVYVVSDRPGLLICESFTSGSLPAKRETFINGERIRKRVKRQSLWMDWYDLVAIESYGGRMRVTIDGNYIYPYAKPDGGIPKTDLSNTVQASLDKADAALQLVATITYQEMDSTFGKGIYRISDTDGLLMVHNPYMNIYSQLLITAAGEIKWRDFGSNNEWGAWNTFYQKPSSGIPKSDLASAVQTSLGKADAAQPLLVSGTNIKTINNESILGSGNITIQGGGGASTWDEIEDKPDFADVATSGSYNDLSNKPTIPDVTGKADKVSSATNGHLAGLNASGNLTDSGIVPSTLVYQGASQGTVPSVDFDPETDTVHVTAQTLSAAQQLQARTNIGAGTSDFSGSYNDLTNKPTIPDAQIQSDWNQTTTTAKDYIKNKPTIPDTTNFVQKSQTSGLLKNDGTVDTSTYLTSAHEVPAGGNSGQVLKKSSATDYDYAWANQTQDYPSAYCKTAAGTAGKTAACTLWTATANTYLHLVIVYANTSASALTLNVNSASAAPLYINGVVSSATNYTLPAGSYIAFYNGTNWYINTDGTIPNVLHKSSTSGLVKNDGTIDTNTYLTSHQDISGKANKVVVVDASTLPSTLDPNKVYQMGTLTGSVTIPAFSTVASGDTEAKIWCFTFNTSTTAPTITWPAAITNWVGGSAPTINASKSYEVTVMDGIGAIMEA